MKLYDCLFLDLQHLFTIFLNQKCGNPKGEYVMPKAVINRKVRMRERGQLEGVNKTAADFPAGGQVNREELCV